MKRFPSLALVVATAAALLTGVGVQAAEEPPGATVRHELQVEVPDGSGVRVAWDGRRLTAGPIDATEVAALMSTGSSSGPAPVAGCWNALWFTVADLPLGPANVAAPLGGAPGTCRTASAATQQSFVPTRHDNMVGVPSWEFVTIGAATGFLTPATAGGEGFAGDFGSSWFTVKCIAESPGVSNVATGAGTVPLIYNCTVAVNGNPLTWKSFGARVVNYQSASGNPGGAGVTGFLVHGV